MHKQNTRESGLLLHISSLSGAEGIGTLGEEAYKFVDFLHKSKQYIWQILPLGHTGYSNSPYASFSAFAGNPLFINTHKLSDFLDENYNFEIKNNDFVDFDKVKEIKIPILKKAAQKFIKLNNFEEFNKFKLENNFWLHDYALFITVKQQFNCKSITEMPADIIHKKEKTISDFTENYKEEIFINEIIQFFFFKQWKELKAYANSKSIKIFGDLPLYISEDSSDLWSKRENFIIDENLKPLKIAGVPPDYFSETGQLWGNPVYDWKYLEQTNFDWWIKRLKFNSEIYDILRIDHFRGLLQFWAVDYGEKTAIKGEWCNVPSTKFFETIFKEIPNANFIAEDLGIITEDVVELRKKYDLPGMKILQFAFDSDSKNPFLPHNFSKNFIAYTGTHDNDTTLGWYSTLDQNTKDKIRKYFNIDIYNIGFSFVKSLWSSIANTTIAPVQDILSLHSDARMNTPGTTKNNWKWRLKTNELNNKVCENLREITELYGRNNK